MDIVSPPEWEPTDRNPLTTAFLGFGIAMLAFFIVGSLIGVLFAMPFLDGGIDGLMKFASDPTSDPAYRVPLLVMQGVASAVGLIIFPLIFLRIRERNATRYLSERNSDWLIYVLSLAVIIFFMGVNALFIDWNANFTFPEFMRGFEEWARSNEENLAEATIFITRFANVGEFLLAFVVIAIIPAIGEEIVFRGILQRKMIEARVNPHLAIWISAILFSAIHIQFFGFVPRLLLGALFGYLYFWTGDLKIAMFAHFVNNGFTLLMAYLNQLGLVEFDMENSESPELFTVGIFAIITSAILYAIHKKSANDSLNEPMANRV